MNSIDLDMTEKEEQERCEAENNAILSAVKDFAHYPRSAFDNYPEAAFQKIAASELEPSKMRKSLEWFLGSPEYKNWCSESSSQFLWHSGPPSFGKTTISLFIGEQLTETFRRHTVYLFCKPDFWPQVPTSAMLVYSMLAQLLIKRPHIIDKIDKVNRPYLIPKSLSLQEGVLWDILRIFMKDMTDCEIHIIVDGIDDVQLDDRRRFLENLRDLWKVSDKPILRILVSSRPYRDIQDCLSDLPFINPDKEISGKCFQYYFQFPITFSYYVGGLP
jgi:hypothetical protein